MQYNFEVEKLARGSASVYAFSRGSGRGLLFGPSVIFSKGVFYSWGSLIQGSSIQRGLGGFIPFIRVQIVLSSCGRTRFGCFSKFLGPKSPNFRPKRVHM